VVAVGALLLIGAGFIIAGLRGNSGSDRIHGGLPAAADPAPIAATARPAVAARLVPVSLRIPLLGVSSSLSQLGLNADKSPQVPTNYQEPGWYKLGPAPGQVRSAVILGHVDDKKGPAVFHKLGSLKAGDKVDVSLTDGAVAHFVIKTVVTYLKAQFPSQQVYGSHGYSGLQLVTCGGKFDSATGHYLVVYTNLVSTTPTKQK
jgi:Sortase domain